MFVTIDSGEESKGRYIVPLDSAQTQKEPKIISFLSMGKHRHRHRRENQENLISSTHSEAKCDDLFCADNPKLMKLGIFTMISLLIHNIPEGIATFSASLIEPRLGIQIAIAIMLHNIPEGICVAVPIFSATGDKKKAFWYATISGLAEPFGALLAWLFLYRILNHDILLMLLAAVAGIMIYISVDTLIPTAKSMDYKHTTILGFSVGMILMGISLIYL